MKTNFIDKNEMTFLSLLQKPWHQNYRTLLTYNMHMKILCNINSQSEISHSNLTKHLPIEKLSICTLYIQHKKLNVWFLAPFQASAQV